MNEEDFPSVFKDLRNSVYLKAASISSNPDNESNLDSPNDSRGEMNFIANTFLDEAKCQNGIRTSLLFHSSTPKTKHEKNSKFKQLSPVRSLLPHLGQLGPLSLVNETGDNSFTTQKLLQLCDVERHLTVEKVMMERIQSMAENNKLLKDSLEHMRQASLEEASARRLVLEQKILDDIHEQELKNRPKREAQLAEDNLKSAQRVLERIQRVKDAENEARRKSENLFKKSRLSVISEDVSCCSKLVDKVKQLHKGLKKEIETINEEAKKKEEVKMEAVKAQENISADNVQKSETPGKNLSYKYKYKICSLIKQYFFNFRSVRLF